MYSNEAFTRLTVTPDYTKVIGFIGNTDTPLDRYWLASRFFSFYYDSRGIALELQYRIGAVFPSAIRYEEVYLSNCAEAYLVSSSGSALGYMIDNYRLRPMVEIPLSSCSLGSKGGGTSALPYILWD